MEENKNVLESKVQVSEEEEEEEEEQTLYEDVEMFDAETLDSDHLSDQAHLQDSSKNGENRAHDNQSTNQDSRRKNRRRRNAKKKKNKNKDSSSSSPNINDINRFVINTCRHLREKKSYLVWNAIGVLGAAAVGDLVKEVDAIQGCGGQLTLDGKRFRTSGGILWNILKTRDPNAFKEIMARGKEFEKQFRRQNAKHNLKGSTEDTCKIPAPASDQIASQVSENTQLTLEAKEQPPQCDSQRRVPISSRIRMPVAYDDLFGENDANELT